jgi:hypothetical protein
LVFHFTGHARRLTRPGRAIRPSRTTSGSRDRPPGDHAAVGDTVRR